MQETPKMINNCYPAIPFSGDRDNLAALINNVGTSTLTAIHDGTGHNLNATQVAAVNNLNATHQNTASVLQEVGEGTRDSMEAANRNGIAIIKEVSDSSRDNIRETSRNGSDSIRETARVGSDLAKDVSDARSSTERTALENRLQMQIISGEIRKDINDTSRDNLIAIKDNLSVIREESCKNQMETIKQGCETREVVKDKFYDLNTEVLKGFAATQLEALKNKCDIEKQIAECCCEQKELTIAQGNATRELILSEGQKRLEAENADLRMQLLLKGKKD